MPCPLDTRISRVKNTLFHRHQSKAMQPAFAQNARYEKCKETASGVVFTPGR